jgi:virulence-associated protein VagC
MPTDAQNRLARKMETGKKQVNVTADRDHVIIEPTASADDDCSAISSNREPAAVGSAPFSILDASRYSLASCATMVEHRRSVVHPNEHQHSLSWFSCTAIVVNYICVGECENK